MNKNLHKNPSVLTHADISSKEKPHVLHYIALHNITEIFPESYINFYTLIYLQFDFPQRNISSFFYPCRKSQLYFYAWQFKSQICIFLSPETEILTGECHKYRRRFFPRIKPREMLSFPRRLQPANWCLSDLNSRNVRHIGTFSGRRANRKYTRARIVIYYGSYIRGKGGLRGRKGGRIISHVSRNLMPGRPIVCKCFAV